MNHEHKQRETDCIHRVSLTVFNSHTERSGCQSLCLRQQLPQNLSPCPQKHLINPKRAADSALPAVTLSIVDTCSPPVCWAFSMEMIFTVILRSFIRFPWAMYTGSPPHLFTHSRMKVSKLVNFVVESAAVLQMGTTKSLLKKFEQGWKKTQLEKENKKEDRF